MFITFLKWLMALTAIVWILLTIPLYIVGKPEMVWAVLIGWGLSALSYVVGFYLVCRSVDAPLNRFMLVFFGGMLARLMVIGVVFLLILLLTQLHVGGFLASLLGFYVLYLILELYFVNSRLRSAPELPR